MGRITQILWKIKHVPNHQPDNIYITSPQKKTHRLHQLRRSPTYLSFEAHTRRTRPVRPGSMVCEGVDRHICADAKDTPTEIQQPGVFPGCGSIFFCEHLTCFAWTKWYPLVISHSYWKWWFSIVMLVYQGVVTVVQPEVSMKLKGFLMFFDSLDWAHNHNTQGIGESMIDSRWFIIGFCQKMQKTYLQQQLHSFCSRWTVYSAHWRRCYSVTSFC